MRLWWSALVVPLVSFGVAQARPATPWSELTTPAPGPPRVIGGYSAGCIAGARPLPVTGPGFRVVHPERHRLFGHPELIALVRQLGKQLKAHHLGLLAVGDLGQPRGGPAPTGHASHQTGLDVDLWFRPPRHGRAISMVDRAHQRPSPAFSAKVVRLIELAAAAPQVERIFINPILKRALCSEVKGPHDWIQKLRPWWGHDDHIHVRLACPADSPGCVPQAPLPPGDGCDALGWWFNPKAEAERTKGKEGYSSRVRTAPPLPVACEALLPAAVSAAGAVAGAAAPSTPTGGNGATSAPPAGGAP